MSFHRGTLVLIGAWVLLSSVGRAEVARSRVALVRTSASDKLLREASTRLRAELEGAGFEVVEVASAPGDPRREVENAAEETKSFATVAIDRAGPGAFADVWISDIVTGKTVVRRLNVGAQSSAASVLAIRALELLRASLLEITTSREAAEPSPEPPHDVVKWVTPVTTTPRGPEDPFAGSALSVGVLGLHGFAGIGPAFGPVARVSHGFMGHAFARFSLAAPLVAPVVSAEGGRARVDQYLSSAELGWSTDARPLGAFVALGVGAFYLHTSGTADAPYRSTSDDAVSFLGSATVGGSARVSRSLAFTVEIAAIGLLPRPIVVIADGDAGSVGAPSVGASLGMLVGL